MSVIELFLKDKRLLFREALSSVIIIFIISTPQDTPHFESLLADGHQFGINLYHANDEVGLAWNDSEIGIDWTVLGVQGAYDGTASAAGYTLADGTPLNLSEKDQKWSGIKDTFRY